MEAPSERPPAPAPASGHRLGGHDGDVAIEAWGPNDTACLTEAMAGLVGSFARTEGVAPRAVRPLRTDEAEPEAALVALLEDVLYRLEVDGEVPVRIHLAAAEGGGYRGEAGVVSADDLEPAGPVPKAITYHDLTVTHGVDGWRCHVVVDR